jgi:hypothetical protein
MAAFPLNEEYLPCHAVLPIECSIL